MIWWDLDLKKPKLGQKVRVQYLGKDGEPYQPHPVVKKVYLGWASPEVGEETMWTQGFIEGPGWALEQALKHGKYGTIPKWWAHL